MKTARMITVAAMTLLVVAGLLAATGPAHPQMMSSTHTSKPFAGPKANKGTVTHSMLNGKSVLTLSADFVVPDTPDPHWAFVDSDGKMTLGLRLKIKNDGYNKITEIPAEVKNVAKVVIWCAWAETNLGEASFEQPIK